MNKIEKLANGNIVVDGKEYEIKTEFKPVNKENLIKNGECYFSTDVFGVIDQYTNDCDEFDKWKNTLGIVASTQKDIEKLKKRAELLYEYERWCSEYPVDNTDSEQFKYYIYFASDKFRIGCHPSCIDMNIYCSNKAHLQKFIDTHDPEDLKLLLGVTKPQRCWLEVE